MNLYIHTQTGSHIYTYMYTYTYIIWILLFWLSSLFWKVQEYFSVCVFVVLVLKREALAGTFFTLFSLFNSSKNSMKMIFFCPTLLMMKQKLKKFHLGGATQPCWREQNSDPKVLMCCLLYHMVSWGVFYLIQISEVDAPTHTPSASL